MKSSELEKYIFIEIQFKSLQSNYSELEKHLNNISQENERIKTSYIQTTSEIDSWKIKYSNLSIENEYKLKSTIVISFIFLCI